MHIGVRSKSFKVCLQNNKVYRCRNTYFNLASAVNNDNDRMHYFYSNKIHKLEIAQIFKRLTELPTFMLFWPRSMDAIKKKGMLLIYSRSQGRLKSEYCYRAMKKNLYISLLCTVLFDVNKLVNSFF